MDSIGFYAAFVALVTIPLIHSAPTVIPCGGRPSDIVFALDTSYSIWPPDFTRQLEFVQDIVEWFNIGDGEEYMRVGVITFATRPLNWINLSNYTEKTALQEAITRVEQDGGGHTYTDKAIDYARVNSFSTDSGARDNTNVTRVLIVITDGRSHEKVATLQAADRARADRIHVFAIGVGIGVEEDELEGIANSPRRDYMFMVDNYQALETIREKLAISACTVTDPPTTTTTTTTTTAPWTRRTPVILTKPPIVQVLPETTPQSVDEFKQISMVDNPDRFMGGPHKNGGMEELRGNQTPKRKKDKIFRNGICAPKKPTDLVFIIDSKTGQPDETRQIWKGVHDIVSRLDMDHGNFRIKFIKECVAIPGVDLSQGKTNFINTINKYHGKSRGTPELLADMRAHLTQPDRLKEDRRRVAVYITDGESGDIQATLDEAQSAKIDNDIDIIGVGIGDQINLTEMRALVSCLEKDHFFKVSKHKKMKKITKKLSSLLCREPSYSS